MKSSERSDGMPDANDKLDRLLAGSESSEPSDRYPRCDFDGLPAVCLGADLAYPRQRCPRCCYRDHIITRHGDPAYLAGHAAAEGVAI